MNKINIPQYIASLGAHVYMAIGITTVVSTYHAASLCHPTVNANVSHSSVAVIHYSTGYGMHACIVQEC